MTGKDLKELVSHIPDDAEAVIDGADFGGYDVCECISAELGKDRKGRYFIGGVDTTNFELEDRWPKDPSSHYFVARTPLYIKED